MQGMEKAEMVEIKCFGVPDESIRNLTKDTVEIRHQETGVWSEYKILHDFEDCPVCGKSMHVLAIRGSTWIACCSQKCYDELDEKKRQLGGLSEAFEYFRKQRGLQ